MADTNNASASGKKKGSPSIWILASLSFLVLIIGFSMYANAPQTSQDVRSRTTTLTDAGFDTPITFTATCSEEDYAQYLDIVRDTFVENNELFDQYNAYPGVNNVYTLNQEAAHHPVEVDSKIIDCIKLSMRTSEVNEKFDVTEGKLLALWHDFRESSNPTLPSQEEIDEAKIHTGIEGVLVDGNTISFADDTIWLDLGSVAKGYTAQEARTRLEEAGLDNGFINAGGNVVLIGHKTDGSSWTVGIQEPDANTALVQFVTDDPTCLVTSGDYQRYVMIDGTRYAHIIDPDTGYPASYVRSVTVIDNDSGWADAMSTALFCMSVQDGLQVCQEQGLEAIWFTDAGSLDLEPDLTNGTFDIYITPGIKDQVRLAG